ncbi:MAG: signal peptidase I [Erysipelotrichales bacterium]|nr:signal peptidase I [Erysipelotrichales bacterium]
MNNDIKSKLGNIVFYVLMAILLVTGIHAKANNEIPSFLGYSFMHVISPSMEETIMTDDVAIGKKVLPEDEITVGDVYIYENLSGLKIIHRIIEENEDGTYTFKGDNNDIADYMPVERNQIEFKYLFRIPYLGYLVKLFKNVYFYAVLIAIFAALEVLSYVKKKNETNTSKE